MYQVDDKGFFGKFGGAYVPEILYKCVTELQEAYKPIIESEEFKKRVLCALEGLCWPSFTSLLCEENERKVWMPTLSEA